jgi:succinylglutamate desuccinylase
MPKPSRDAIEREEEIFDYLRQSHISAKNTARLRQLAASQDPRIAELAAIVIEVAQVKPFKRKRLQVLARERRDLLAALERTGLMDAHHG